MTFYPEHLLDYQIKRYEKTFEDFKTIPVEKIFDSWKLTQKQMKGYITKQIGFSIWQKSFNDHIIRGEKDYKEIWEYIENNLIK